jgi:hypothetical protein
MFLFPVRIVPQELIGIFGLTNPAPHWAPMATAKFEHGQHQAGFRKTQAMNFREVFYCGEALGGIYAAEQFFCQLVHTFAADTRPQQYGQEFPVCQRLRAQYCKAFPRTLFLWQFQGAIGLAFKKFFITTLRIHTASTEKRTAPL